MFFSKPISAFLADCTSRWLYVHITLDMAGIFEHCTPKLSSRHGAGFFHEQNILELIGDSVRLTFVNASSYYDRSCKYAE